MALTSFVTLSPQTAKRPPIRSQRSEFVPCRKVAILGFGTVGRAVGELLSQNSIPGLRLTHVFNRDVERKRVPSLSGTVKWTESFAEVLSSEADVVVELIGGLDPAYEFIRRALLSGKSVVTANKHVMAKHGVELLALARKMGKRLEYGASVGGVVPVLPALQYGLSADRLFRAIGVLNGTCNYILGSMETRGATMASALAHAQKLGYAEADPSDDVNGLDAACKLAIVARVGLRAELNPFQIARQSIEGIEPVDFKNARQLGCTIRQISFVELKKDRVVAAVGPALVPLQSPLANTHDNQNALIVSGENSGDTLLAGRGAGGAPTSVAVVSDLMSMLAERGPGLAEKSLYTHSETIDLSARHYIRYKTGSVTKATKTRQQGRTGRKLPQVAKSCSNSPFVLTRKSFTSDVRQSLAADSALVLPILE